MPRNINSDLHCHPSLKAFHSGNKHGNIWKNYPENKRALKKLSRLIKKDIRDIARSSQTNLERCIEGDTNLIFASIYPFERPFLAANPRRPFRMAFAVSLPKRKYKYLGEAVLGIPADKMQEKIDEAERGDPVNYFEEYLQEVEHFVSPENKHTDNPRYSALTFEVATNFEDVNHVISLEEPGVVGVLTVEGIHAFGNYDFQRPFQLPYNHQDLHPNKLKALKESILENLTFVKQQTDKRKVPLFVSLCHHFNNLIAGHARSLSGKSTLLDLKILKLNKPGMRYLFNQEPGLDLGLSSAGIEIVHKLLEKGPGQGRRILIDTKHMSVDTRREFYHLLQEQYQGDPVPIIHSHGAVNGWKTLAEASNYEGSTSLDQNRFFSRWNINLCDEDIEVTFKSRGLIGIIMHEDRMPGRKFGKQMKKARRNPQKCKDLCMQLFWSNIFHVAKVQLEMMQRTPSLQDRSNWDGISIGSDYDGILNPFDNYADVSKYPNLRQDMKSYLLNGKPILHVSTEVQMTQTEVDQVINGFSVAEILNKVFLSNNLDFLKEFYHDDYLSASG